VWSLHHVLLDFALHYRRLRCCDGRFQNLLSVTTFFLRSFELYVTRLGRDKTKEGKGNKKKDFEENI
jgi:hypothetical protein